MTTQPSTQKKPKTTTIKLADESDEGSSEPEVKKVAVATPKKKTPNMGGTSTTTQVDTTSKKKQKPEEEDSKPNPPAKKKKVSKQQEEDDAAIIDESNGNNNSHHRSDDDDDDDPVEREANKAKASAKKKGSKNNNNHGDHATDETPPVTPKKKAKGGSPKKVFEVILSATQKIKSDDLKTIVPENVELQLNKTGSMLKFRYKHVNGKDYLIYQPEWVLIKMWTQMKRFVELVDALELNDDITQKKKDDAKELLESLSADTEGTLFADITPAKIKVKASNNANARGGNKEDGEEDGGGRKQSRNSKGVPKTTRGKLRLHVNTVLECALAEVERMINENGDLAYMNGKSQINVFIKSIL